jgi:hypothetical protein
MRNLVPFIGVPFIGVSSISALSVAYSLAAPTLAQTKKSVMVLFAEVGMAIAKPDGFDKAETFNGFQQPSTNSSIMLTSMPAPFSAIKKGFNTEQLASRGLKLLSKGDVTINGQPGFLLHIAQSVSGQDFLKWIVVFGDEAQTNVVTAIFPKERSGDLGVSLKQVVLGVSIAKTNRQDIPTLPFTLTPAPGLVRVPKTAALGKVLAFTKDGRFQSTKPSDPLLITALSLGAVPVIDPASFATRYLYQTSYTIIEKIESTLPINLDGLDGYETIAKGTDRKTGLPIKVYQVMLFPEAGGYVIMTGLVGAENAALYLPKFKATARTYRGKSSPLK